MKISIRHHWWILLLSFFLVMILGFGIMIIFKRIPVENSASNLHTQHLRMAQKAQNIENSGQNLQNLSGTGDKTRRFTVSFLHPEVITPGTDTELRFEVFDANTGNQVGGFQKVYEKYLHLIVVDKNLQSFQHIHPLQIGKQFVIKTQFHKSGVYHLYLNFQPLGATEQQFAFSVPVGETIQPKVLTAVPDQTRLKTLGAFEFELQSPKPLKASLLATGNQRLTFTLRNAKNHEPIQNLKPYLGAFGHLVMINTKTFEYIHVHPTNLYPPEADASGGPDVEFMPMGLYGPIKPGIYRLFAQFNPGGNLIVIEYTLEISE